MASIWHIADYADVARLPVCAIECPMWCARPVKSCTDGSVMEWKILDGMTDMETCTFQLPQ